LYFTLLNQRILSPLFVFNFYHLVITGRDVICDIMLDLEGSGRHRLPTIPLTTYVCYVVNQSFDILTPNVRLPDTEPIIGYFKVRCRAPTRLSIVKMNIGIW